jgi:hypothetical protein
MVSTFISPVIGRAAELRLGLHEDTDIVLYNTGILSLLLNYYLIL